MEYDNTKCGVGVVLSLGVTPWSLSWVGAIMGYDTVLVCCRWKPYFGGT